MSILGQRGQDEKVVAQTSCDRILKGASADSYAMFSKLWHLGLQRQLLRAEIKVIQVQSGGTLILNCGNVFLKVGNILALSGVCEQIISPETGEVLGEKKTEMGTVQVAVVEPKFSKAIIAGEAFPISVSSVLRCLPMP